MIHSEASLPLIDLFNFSSKEWARSRTNTWFQTAHSFRWNKNPSFLKSVLLQLHRSFTDWAQWPFKISSVFLCSRFHHKTSLSPHLSWSCCLLFLAWSSNSSFRSCFLVFTPNPPDQISYLSCTAFLSSPYAHQSYPCQVLKKSLPSSVVSANCRCLSGARSDTNRNSIVASRFWGKNIWLCMKSERAHCFRSFLKSWNT